MFSEFDKEVELSVGAQAWNRYLEGAVTAADGVMQELQSVYSATSCNTTKAFSVSCAASLVRAEITGV